MKYVLDASVGLKWVLPESDSAKAIALGQEYGQRIHELIAPDTYPPEIAHALTRAERKGTITPQDGAQYFVNLLATLPKIHPTLPLLPRAYELSSQFRLGVFDCLYVALAERAMPGCDCGQENPWLFPAHAVSLDAL